MAKRKTGHAKTTAIRLETVDLTDIKLLRKVLKKKYHGDVIHELIGMFKLKQIGHYGSPLKERNIVEQSVYDELAETCKNLKSTIDRLCDRQGITFAQAMELAKCQT